MYAKRITIDWLIFALLVVAIATLLIVLPGVISNLPQRSTGAVNVSNIQQNIETKLQNIMVPITPTATVATITATVIATTTQTMPAATKPCPGDGWLCANIDDPRIYNDPTYAQLVKSYSDQCRSWGGGYECDEASKRLFLQTLAQRYGVHIRDSLELAGMSVAAAVTPQKSNTSAPPSQSQQLADAKKVSLSIRDLCVKTKDIPFLDGLGDFLQYRRYDRCSIVRVLDNSGLEDLSLADVFIRDAKGMDEKDRMRDAYLQAVRLAQNYVTAKNTNYANQTATAGAISAQRTPPPTPSRR